MIERLDRRAGAGTSALVLGRTDRPPAEGRLPGRAESSAEEGRLTVVYGRPKHSHSRASERRRADCSFAGRITVDPPARRREAKPGELGTSPASAAGGCTDGPDASGQVSDRRAADPVETVLTNPRDLAGLWVAIGVYLEEMVARGGRAAVCFDSLTALLGHASAGRVCRFVQLLVDRFREANVAVHFHLDPSAHRPETVARLRSVVDTTIAESPAERSVAVPAGTATAGPAGPASAVGAVSDSPERRGAVESLLAVGGRATLDELAARIVVTIDTGRTVDAVRLALYHDHLPRLATTGLVAFDPRAERVRLLASPETVRWLASEADRSEARSTPDDR